MKKRYKITIGIFILIIIAIIGVSWYLEPYEPMDKVEMVFESEDITAVNDNNLIVFEPIDMNTKTGVIFYPGARVIPKSYAPLAGEIAKTGYFVVIVPMPLNLAVLGVDKADEVINRYSDIENWVIGGHSLGGAMAARYAYNNTSKISGLILLDSYPADNNNLSNKDIRVISIYGNQEGIAIPEKIDKSREYLPEDTRWVEIKGGNHSQFGWYGLQSGDYEATISREKQQSITVNAIGEFLSSNIN